MFQKEFNKIRKHFDLIAGLADKGIITHDSNNEVSIWTPEAIARARRVGDATVRFDVTVRATGKEVTKYTALDGGYDALDVFSRLCTRLNVLAMA